MNEPNKTIVQTNKDVKDGQNKCPMCGSTDISTNTQKGKLRCNFCRHEFEVEKLEGMVTDLENLQGEVLASGAQDISASAEDVVTFKCSSCGAEVVLDTSSALNARCHWCRNTLSQNQQIPNGAVPDVVLPFGIDKQVARDEIERFVGKRKFFAHPQFTKEFTTENIMGVYFPYMLVDVNSHVDLKGQGEHQVRSYTEKEGDHYNTYYDADLFNVERKFDLIINGLTIESSLDRLDKHNKEKTNNIINAIMPFDIESCAKYNAHYLQGYSSEKRDTNIDDLKEIVGEQAKDIARFSANETLKEYDRGVRWDNENLKVKGQQWTSAYLPVWLYSYQEKKGEKSVLHYVAVNARTKKTMGSVPIHMPKLIAISAFIELLGILGIIFLEDFRFRYLFALIGIIYYFVMYARYRNAGARHHYETQTKTKMNNLEKQDQYVRRETRLSSSVMEGANNKSIHGESTSKRLVNNLINQNGIASAIKKQMEQKKDE
ncbi:MAG: TFIIB-type zinc ribbon-containing protein [Bacilli bacterium]|nr:TFIIB-type zinc ribbon-containing protein [Bacilli bacterium]